MATRNTISVLSLRALPLFLILSLILPLEARIGSSSSGRTSSEGQIESDSDVRNLGGGYGKQQNHNYWNNKHNNQPKHNGQYYIKRYVDPSEYYHDYEPTADHNTSTKEPSYKPTVKPTNKPPIGQPITFVTYEPTPLPTLQPPTKQPIEPPQPNPTLAPMPVAVDPPPTFDNNDIDIVIVDNNDSNKATLTPGDNSTITFEPPSPIQSRIAEFALLGGAEFEDTSSYQFAALKRVEEQVGADTMTDVKLMQYYSLYCIFEATHSKTNDFIVQARAFGENIGSGNDDNSIPGWKITTGWQETNLDPCEGEWYGLACDEDDRIVNVDLFDNGLTGNFAKEIVFLAGEGGVYSTGAGALVSLDIFNNELMSNNGDNSWISDLGNQLGYLYFQNTMFSGALPAKFPDGLVELDIANSLITGDLQGAAFENLSSLRFLLMDGVQFDSSIPSEIASLPNLEYMFATDSMITGDLSYMESMPVIFEHWVDRNPKLGGSIPSFIGSLTTLQSFSIAECDFTGTIPESLGNLGLMQQMWLYGNSISGEIPASIGKLSFMRIFEVEENNLSDSMPQSICDNFSNGMLEVLGADCDKLDCPCCTCCSVEECRAQN